MQYFLGWPFVTDGKDVLSTGSTNPNLLTNWFTEKVMVTNSQSSLKIVINLGSDPHEVGYVCLYNITVPDSSLSPTWQVEIFDGENATGNVVKDSGILSSSIEFLVESDLVDIRPDPPQLIHVWTVKQSGGRLVEDPTSIARSIQISFETSGPADWTLGYIAAGAVKASSETSEIGGGLSPLTPARHRPTMATGGGTTHSSLVNPSTVNFDIPHMSASDAETLRALYSQLGVAAPFFLYPSSGRDSRLAQGGIVRFSDSSLKLEPKDNLSGPAGKFRMTSRVSPWR